ncbi:aTP synthase epsilon chain 2 [Clostridium sp. CAG:632]|jgi:F-type H+-transporting ATPase subunit epsilon|nr:ATP synthase F1 subunit epsilon [Clostridium sp.]CCY58701.1 aTP synthase epsilon chain 2 [Clostridium sp. CAG:632]
MADKTFRLKIVAPERIFYEDDVPFVEFRTTEGEIGVYPGHIPLTSIIAPGVVRIHTTDGEIKEAALLEGFSEILPNEVVILAEAVEWPDEIDANRAKEAQIRAERRLQSQDGDMNRAELALKRAIVRQRLAK